MDMSNLKPAVDLAAMRASRFKNETREYAQARTSLLAEEIEARRHLTRLAEQRRRLPPGPLVEKDYRFKDENGSELGLADLFGRHDTLVTYFWMFGPQRERPCPMCTNFLGGANGNGADVKQRVAFKIIGRSPVERQRAFAMERGWRDLDFVQTVGDAYARDLGLLDDKGNEYPGLTVYQKDGSKVRVFYNAEMPAAAADPGQDPRGSVDVAPLWNILDLTPAGRGTDWYPKLSY
ncbi:hypothetical protein ATY81_15995 [Rhizobium sp. R72]|uniref:DUF899 family protein n=1 Tax=unclassified Rhizobium TaxID=2613769 RepID=UPI000B53230D|nr:MULTISPECIES: DUF899 family protein [unclassified Rhizobium]OWV92671.1 hypothetical protein ATY81_15995 [Rhizobium sp. R72]OWV92882.1 hypothetical protein ATY80_15995 [Rhizobium sp. R711]